MIRILAVYMRQQYLIWNKDTVTEQTIFNDIKRLSDDRNVIPEGMHLGAIGNESNYQQPRMMQNNGGQQNNNRVTTGISGISKIKTRENNAIFRVEGGHRLKGEVIPQGAKNEALQVLSAVLLTSEEVIVHNVPDILDVNKLIELLADLGLK